MSPFKRERLSKEVKSGIKDTAVYPSASHTPSGGGGVRTPAKVDLDEASEAPARISYSQVQIGRDPHKSARPLIFIRWLAVFTDHSLESNTCLPELFLP